MTVKRPQQDRYNPTNERAKYKYRTHLRRALKKDEKTLIATLKHIREFELFTGYRDFREFNQAVADKYISALFEQERSLPHINDNTRAMKEFLRWLERQRGYKSRINYNHIDYLNISANQRRTAKATEYKKTYSYPQILSAIRHMPDSSGAIRR